MSPEYRGNNSNGGSRSTGNKNFSTVSFLTIYLALSGLRSNSGLNTESSVTVLTMRISCTGKLIDMSILIAKDGSTNIQCVLQNYVGQYQVRKCRDCNGFLMEESKGEICLSSLFATHCARG
jgi:hypothetical protein